MKLTSFKSILLQVLIFTLIFLLWELMPVNLDLKIQDMFYLFHKKTWLFSEQHLLHLILYDGIKIMIGLFTLGVLGLFLSSWYIPHYRFYRRHFLMLVLMVILTPSFVAFFKKYTNTYCPWAINRYGGSSPYVKVIEKYPEAYELLQKSGAVGRGYCFPGGHASGGFALLCLPLLISANRKKLRRAAFIFSMGLGWLMGFHQMLRGAHYFSHILVTNMFAWILALLLYRLLRIKDRE